MKIELRRCTTPSGSGGTSRCPSCGTEPFSTAAVAQLEQLRLAALEERIDADLALGREAALVTELESLVAEHPYRERLRAQLMLALYRSGRQADALDAYQAGRRVLQDDLGLEPGNELRDLEAAILRQDEALSPARPVPAAESDQPPPSRRLSRRAVIVAGPGGLAAVALGGGVTAVRSRESGGTQVQPGSVGVVDPVARQVVAEIPVGFSSPLIAAGEGAVWLVDGEGSTLTGIDPKTNAFVLPRRGIPVEGVPTGLAAGDGSVWIALNEGRVLSVLEVGPEFRELRRRIPLEKSDDVISVVRTRQAHGRRGRRLGPRAGTRAGQPDRPGNGQAQAARRGRRCLVVDRSRRRCRLARRPRRRDEARLAHRAGARERARGPRCPRRDHLDRGRPRRRLVRRRLEHAPVAHRSTERVDPGLRTDRGEPQRGGRRGGRGRVGRRRFGHLALAPGSHDERRRDDSRLGATSGGLVAELRQDLD